MPCLSLPPLNLPSFSWKPLLLVSKKLCSHPSFLLTPFKYWKALIRSPWSVVFFLLNSSNSLSQFWWEGCSVPLIIFGSLWTHSNRLLSCFFLLVLLLPQMPISVTLKVVKCYSLWRFSEDISEIWARIEDFYHFLCRIISWQWGSLWKRNVEMLSQALLLVEVAPSLLLDVFLPFLSLKHILH